MIGPGKYDHAAEMLLRELKAKGIVLLVIDGISGHGMSVKSDPATLALLPSLLVMTANQITEAVDADLAQIAEKLSAEHRTNEVSARAAADFHEANAKNASL